MAEEIERKFVLPGPPPWLAGCRREAIEQGYVVVADDGAEARVRRIGDRTVLTFKRGGGLRRREVEIEISEEQFDALRPLTEGRRITKVRHSVPADGGTIEVDVYGGGLEGLVVAEIEFESAEAAAAFAPPQWMGQEVTGERRYSNAALATEGIPHEEGAR